MVRVVCQLQIQIENLSQDENLESSTCNKVDNSINCCYHSIQAYFYKLIKKKNSGFGEAYKA